MQPSAVEHRKRKRRRRRVGPPLSSWVQPSDELGGNEALVHPQLYAELCRNSRRSVTIFAGIAPWSPPSLRGDTQDGLEESTWTILPVRPAEEESGSTSDTIRIPRASVALLSLLQRLEANPFSHQSKRRDAYEARIVEVQPLELEKIYISVRGDALKKHEEVQHRFGGGFVGMGKKPAKVVLMDDVKTRGALDDELTSALRQALGTAIITRQGDLLPLPLPAHPITHVPFPPAQILLCEPVAQGLPTSRTKIIVSLDQHSASSKQPHTRPLPILSHSKSLTDFDITDGDGTSNEAYHSALEDGNTSDDQAHTQAYSAQPDDDSGLQFDDISEDSGSSSDDLSENLITMSTPALAAKRPSMMSSRATATPRGYAARAHGVSTPGSIFSNMTGMTARRDHANRGRPFKAHALQYKVPDELLYPAPSLEDDDICRVFVDMKILVRLGCFSGDWVKLTPVTRFRDHPDPLAGPTAAERQQDEDYRPAKIFGLSDIQPASVPRSAGGMPLSRRSSTFSGLGAVSSALNAWFSPILLANMGGPESVTISVLRDASTDRPASRSKMGPRKMDGSATPPVAREMTLLRVSTPLSTEKVVQNGLFSSLKRYFEAKRRIVQKDDLIGVPLDARTCRLFARTGQGAESEDELDELLNFSDSGQRNKTLSSDLAWFKVGAIVGPEPLEASDMIPDIWNGAACIEPHETRMRQAGIEQCKIPPNSANILQYSCGSSPSVDNLSIHAFTASPSQSYVSTVQRRLRELIAATTSPRAIHLKMDPVKILLHSSQRNIGKATLATLAADHLGLHSFNIDSYDLLAEGNGGGDAKAEAFLKARVVRAMSSGAAFTSLLIRHIEALSADRMVIAMEDIVKDVRLLIATTTELDQLPEGIRSLFTHEIEVAAPDEGEREGLLCDIVRERRLKVASDVDFGSIAVKTAALVAGNLVDVVERASIARQTRLERLISTPYRTAEMGPSMTVRDVLISGGETALCITKMDFELAVEAARKNFADSIGAPKIPNVSWNDVGGLEHVKDAVLETIQLPLERPELFAKGMRKRSGILFYGPPGTGKTLLAKAIATEFSLNFFSIKGPELLNMYIGESEANVRRVFQRARDARPCVVFFDELDSVAPKRGNQGDSGGVMDRIVSQLLAELDGIGDGEEGAGGVFVIGATNRPDLLDPALLRPGRFDKMLYLGVSDTHEKQLTILEALTRKFTVHPELSLRRVAESLPLTYTGADLYALCSDAMLKAITRQASAVDANIKSLPGGPVTHAYFFDHLATPEDIAVSVTEEDFAAAQRELVPSVSAKELDHYKRVRHDFEGDSKPINLTNGLAPPSNTELDGQPARRLKSSKKRSQVGRSSSENMSSKGKGRAKGNAKTWDSDDDDDEGFMTPNGFSTP